MTALFEIPCRVDSARYSMDIALGEVPYVLAFEFNQRNSTWYLSVSTSADEPIFSGVAIVLDWPLLRGSASPLWAGGDFLAIDTGPNNDEPGLSDLGNRVKLFYVQP